LTKIAVDTNTLKDVFTDSLLKITAHLLTVMGMFAIMFAVNWQISLIALATFPFLCYSLFHVYRKTKAAVKMQRKQEGKLASRMTEVFSAISLVQAFAREKHEEEQFDSVTAQTLEQSIRVARLEAVATRSTELITAVGTAGAMFFGALAVLNGNMIPGELLLFSFYLTNMYKPIRNLAKLSTDFSKAMASAERISEILELEPEIADPEHLGKPAATDIVDPFGKVVEKARCEARGINPCIPILRSQRSALADVSVGRERERGNIAAAVADRAVVGLGRHHVEPVAQVVQPGRRSVLRQGIRDVQHEQVAQGDLAGSWHQLALPTRRAPDVEQCLRIVLQRGAGRFAHRRARMPVHDPPHVAAKPKAISLLTHLRLHHKGGVPLLRHE